VVLANFVESWQVVVLANFVDGCMAVQSAIASVSEVSAGIARVCAPDSTKDRFVDCALQH
jgi:hypothetical protein